MTVLDNPEQLNDLRLSVLEHLNNRRANQAVVLIGMGTCGIAAGASEVAEAMRKELAQRNLNVKVIGVGCIGMCVKEPLVDIQLPGRPRVTYANEVI
jgi:NADP-reducing hydrogenase subunit HndB